MGGKNTKWLNRFTQKLIELYQFNGFNFSCSSDVLIFTSSLSLLRSGHLLILDAEIFHRSCFWSFHPENWGCSSPKFIRCVSPVSRCLLSSQVLKCCWRKQNSTFQLKEEVMNMWSSLLSGWFSKLVWLIY